jgi:hypothetical protein
MRAPPGITLGISAASQQRDIIRSERGSVGMENMNLLTGRSILIVEDEPLIASYVAELMTDGGAKACRRAPVNDLHDKLTSRDHHPRRRRARNVCRLPDRFSRLGRLFLLTNFQPRDLCHRSSPES